MRRIQIVPEEEEKSPIKERENTPQKEDYAISDES
jgi:hypothetical protein